MANFKIIRELCEQKKITIRELASRVGIKENAVHKIIQNGSTNTKTIEEIAKVFDVSVGIFFENSNNFLNENVQILNTNADFYIKKYISVLEENKQLRIELDGLKTELFEMQNKSSEFVS